jgi:hypothetical protein
VTAGSIADLDPVAWALAVVRGSAVLLEEFGGADHMSGLNEAPYPRLRIAPSPNVDDRRLWLTDTEVLVQAWGDVAGHPGGQADLRRLCYLAVDVLYQQNYAPYGGGPVIAQVTPTGVTWSPLTATGQPRWVSAVMVRAHPPVG